MMARRLANVQLSFKSSVYDFFQSCAESHALRWRLRHENHGIQKVVLRAPDQFISPTDPSIGLTPASLRTAIRIRNPVQANNMVPAPRPTPSRYGWSPYKPRSSG